MDLESQVGPEDLARSLIREFFLKLGYKNSLDIFEKEDKRPRIKMTKLDLIKFLSMERLIKNNKQKIQPQQTMLEILTDYLFSKFKGRQSNGGLSGDKTNANLDEGQSVYSQNIRNQEYQDSVYGSQTNITNKISNIQGFNNHRPLIDNNYSNSGSTGNSNISNGSNNIGVNSYLSQKNNRLVSGLSSHISSTTNNSNSQPHSSNQSWTSQNILNYPQSITVEQSRPPKSACQQMQNQNNSKGTQQQLGIKPMQQHKDFQQEKEGDYLSYLEDQSKKSSNNSSGLNIGTPQQLGVNSINTNKDTTSPFTDQTLQKNFNFSNTNNDDGEFKFESRRGNMKKVARPPSSDKRKLQHSEQITSIRTSINGQLDTNVTNSNITTTKNQNSEFFNNFNELINQGSSQNNKLDFNDPLFGEVTNQSQLLSQMPSKISNINNNDSNENAEQIRPVSRQNKSNLNEQLQPSNQSNQAPSNVEDSNSKQFNFFNKKKKQEDVPQENNKQSSFSALNQMHEEDDFDKMLGANQAATSIKQFENPKNKKGIFDDDDDLDFSQNQKSRRKVSQQDTKEQIGSNLNDSEHAKINFFEPGKVNFDFQPPKINFSKTAGIQTFSKKNIQSLSGTEVQDIKRLLFNQSQNKFLPASWSQGFILNENDDCFYGLFQKEGGPCGVIACVQAFYLKYLFFIYPTISQTAGRNLQDFKNKIVKENCLVAALAEILFNCKGDDGVLRLAIIQNQQGANSSSQSAPIDCCGYISAKVNSIEQAYDALHAYKSDYIGQHNQGVTTFLYSVILTKGIKAIQEEMDSSENALIGHHGHCSQEQVNLFLTGKARSNCFDGEKVLDGDYKLKGIDKRSQFGFLTIFEHLKYIEVGSYLKTPLFPIWIICKEYHYSVIFAKDFRANEKAQQPHFDLVYYDELYNPQDRIILTVTQKKYAKSNYISSQTSDQQHFLFKKKNEEDDDMIPVIELVMRTKWGKEISVDWNGTQPIL
ncbi:hypothetical protein ABPG72_010664 [Tetrahymena utriculariae]